MKPQPFVVTPKDYSRALNVLGTKITILASNTVTQGYEVTLQEGEEGYGPPPHSHDWDESFYVIRGKVEFSYGDKIMIAAPGTFAHMPAGTVHGFRFGAGGGTMIEITSQGGFASKMFTAIDKEIPPDSPDITKLIEILNQHGIILAE